MRMMLLLGVVLAGAGCKRSPPNPTTATATRSTEYFECTQAVDSLVARWVQCFGEKQRDGIRVLQKMCNKSRGNAEDLSAANYTAHYVLMASNCGDMNDRVVEILRAY